MKSIKLLTVLTKHNIILFQICEQLKSDMVHKKIWSKSKISELAILCRYYDSNLTLDALGFIF